MVELDGVVLGRGSHAERADGVCALEAVAWLAGEEHTDSPACVSPAIADFVLDLNDAWSDEARQELKPYLPRLIGTAGSPEADERRAWLGVDWIVRGFVPVWLRAARLTRLTRAPEDLEGLPEIVDAGTLAAAGVVLGRARKRAEGACWFERGISRSLDYSDEVLATWNREYWSYGVSELCLQAWSRCCHESGIEVLAEAVDAIEAACVAAAWSELRTRSAAPPSFPAELALELRRSALGLLERMIGVSS